MDVLYDTFDLLTPIMTTQKYCVRKEKKRKSKESFGSETLKEEKSYSK